MQNNRSYIFFVFLIASASVLIQCAAPPQKTKTTSLINTAHLDHLYDEIVVEGDTVGMVHIYAEYPDYHFVGDADEGFTCVDDVARAAIFYMRHYRTTSNPVFLDKGRMLMKFVLALQADNGYYYNFVWPDGRIHREGVTSKAEPNFWSWRALWSLSEAVDLLPADDPLLPTIKSQRKKLVLAMLSEESFSSFETDTSMGWTFPTWLPRVSGTDQAAIVLIGLSMMLEQSDNYSIDEIKAIKSLMHHFADGIRMMQVVAPGKLPDGAFLSWENLWHAYANIQSYGLLMAGEVLNDPAMTRSALYEVDNFYPAVLAVDGLESLWIRVDNGVVDYYNAKQFHQIAYGRQPMIWGALKAFEVTGEEKYLTLAKELSQWFFGKNPASTIMYDAATGRGYDGIIDRVRINKNAGAESTIEALMSIQLLEQTTKN